jgi:S-adenosylmethionine hydrolase
MAIVTLTSDLGTNNHIVSLIKGSLLHAEPIPVIIDISHEIRSFDIIQAAFMVAQSWRAFPPGTIHIVVVNDLPEAHFDWVITQREGHYFIIQNNGLASLIFSDEEALLYSIPVSLEPFFTLPLLLRKIIFQLSTKESLSDLSELTPVTDEVKRYKFQPVADENKIIGSVLYVDSFENVITNISRDLFDSISIQRPFSLKMRSHQPLTVLSKHYSDVSVGEILCLFNSAGLLEIAINMGKASSLFGLNPGETIHIEFEAPY